MSKAIGGYVRRGDRRYVPPVPDDGIPRCGYCHARLDLGMWPHICKEVTFGTALSPTPMIPFEVPEAAGGFLQNMLGDDPAAGPPWTHTFRPPEPIGWDDDGNPLYPEQGPAHTLTTGAGDEAEDATERA